MVAHWDEMNEIIEKISFSFLWLPAHPHELKLLNGIFIFYLHEFKIMKLGHTPGFICTYCMN